MTTESPDRPTRMEQEVREILERAESQRTPIDLFGETVHRRKIETQQKLKRASPPSVSSRYLTPEILRIIGAFALAILAIILGEVSRLLATISAIASLVVFFSLWFPTARVSSTNRPRWRGRDLN